ncbi:hypothetical protein [Catenulispora rubra]|uniref:hypothetical protein n=1 Tax=Catenulispora rubra TaxID=280293 RepID=UPI00189227E9|nr:hypothetical protein [Catenulispora rubra]
MQPDVFKRTVDDMHAAAEHTFADHPSSVSPLPTSTGLSGVDRRACTPTGTGSLTFLDVHGVMSEPIPVPGEVSHRLAGGPADEQLAQAAREHDAVCAVLSLPVQVNLDHVVCADPAALASSADPGADRHAHPGIVTVAAYTAPVVTAPLVRLSLTGDRRVVRIAPHPDVPPVPPPAARWLRLLLP